MNGPDKMECRIGMLQGVSCNVAVIKSNGCTYWSGLEDVFLIEDKISGTIGPRKQKTVDEMIICKYMGEMTDMEGLLRFPLLYDLEHNQKPRETYKRRVKELAGIDIQ